MVQVLWRINAPDDPKDGAMNAEKATANSRVPVPILVKTLLPLPATQWRDEGAFADMLR